VISNLIEGKPIPLYGDGKQKRCWISAKTYAEILYQLIENQVPHGVYNVRGKETYDNFTLVSKIRSLYMQLSGLSHTETAPIIYVPDRKAHDLYYHIDDTKVQTYISVRYECMDTFLYDEIKEQLQDQ
jgi:dTDP-glucose 4,6-dehydratase